MEAFLIVGVRHFYYYQNDYMWFKLTMGLMLWQLGSCHHLAAQLGGDKLNLLFGGDIMAHDTQLAAAYVDSANSYDFSDSFHHITQLVSLADIAFANLETTFGGVPYTSYPDFSSPETLAVAIKNCGFDVLVTANNHSADKGKRGIVRTNRVLDSLGLLHTGTFTDSADYKHNHPLMISKNGISLAVLNYTYGINSPRYPKGSIVNVIDTSLMRMDLLEVQRRKPDLIVVFLHWGEEYLAMPTAAQLRLTQWLAANGVQLVIGSHPHVLQCMEWHAYGTQNHAVAYSLGNLLSGQRTAPRDGAAMLNVEVTKQNGVTRISNVAYTLTYVYYPKINGIRHFMVVPVCDAENGLVAPGEQGWGRMSVFAQQARLLLRKNINVNEFVPQKSPE